MARKAQKPLLLGYYSARRGIPDDHVVSVRKKLVAFAWDEGYALAGMFAEPSEEPSVALQALIDSAARRDVEAVAVPSIIDLGSDEFVQQATLRRLEDAGVRVLVLVGGA